MWGLHVRIFTTAFFICPNSIIMITISGRQTPCGQLRVVYHVLHSLSKTASPVRTSEVGASGTLPPSKRFYLVTWQPLLTSHVFSTVVISHRTLLPRISGIIDVYFSINFSLFPPQPTPATFACFSFAESLALETIINIALAGQLYFFTSPITSLFSLSFWKQMFVFSLLISLSHTQCNTLAWEENIHIRAKTSRKEKQTDKVAIMALTH